MKEAIRQQARILGFDDCRFTHAAAPETIGYFRAWLDRQYHGEMAWLARGAEKRADLERVLAGLRSVISLGAGYSAGDRAVRPGPRSENSPPSGRAEPEPAGVAVVARYARGTDYHEVLGARLKCLQAFLAELGGPATQSLWYVDTGPILERDLAQRSGLGFMGKHTNLISRRLGNWFCIAEILTTLELEPDPPERNHCGACIRCLQACPTGAITAPFQLDARRCISYLTIELKGPIPVEWRPAIGARVFGCDDCLAACPWNRFAQAGGLLAAHGRSDLDSPRLLDWLVLDEAGFQRLFRGTPLARARRRGLLRNVCVALGNVGDATALPALERACHDPEPLIATHAVWAVEQIRSRGRDGRPRTNL